MPGVTNAMMADLYKLAQAEQAGRALTIAKYWSYYDGDQKKFLKVTDGTPDYNVIVNLCARVVDQSVNFLVGETPTIDLPGDDDVVKSNELLIKTWLEQNDFEDLVSELFVQASVSGHAFVKLLQTEERVRLVVLDTSLVTAFWSPMDKSDVVAYVITWTDPVTSDMYREDHVKDGAKWVITSYTGKGNNWVMVDQTIWPYPFAQIVEWKNLPAPRKFYGVSDLAAAVGLNDAYNFRQSNTNKILYIHAHPRTIAYGVGKDQISKTAIDGLWTIQDTSARIENLEMQSDLESSRRHGLDIKSDLFADTQTVDLSSVKDKVGQLTNFGLKMMFTEALTKNEKKRRLAGRGLAELVRRVGVMMHLNWEGARVIWGDPLPQNREEQVMNAKETIAMEVSSRQTESEALGYDWERESKRMAEEKEASEMKLGVILKNNLSHANSGLDTEE